MPDPLEDDHPTTDGRYGDDSCDVVITYSAIEDGITSARKIEGTILEEREKEFDVKLEVIDNTNTGMFAIGDMFEDYTGGDHEEFTETLTIEKSEVPYYQDDFPNVQAHIPKGVRVSPIIRDWSEEEPFRA